MVSINSRLAVAVARSIFLISLMMGCQSTNPQSVLQRESSPDKSLSGSGAKSSEVAEGWRRDGGWYDAELESKDRDSLTAKLYEVMREEGEMERAESGMLPSGDKEWRFHSASEEMKCSKHDGEYKCKLKFKNLKFSGSVAETGWNLYGVVTSLHAGLMGTAGTRRPRIEGQSSSKFIECEQRAAPTVGTRCLFKLD